MKKYKFADMQEKDFKFDGKSLCKIKVNIVTGKRDFRISKKIYEKIPDHVHENSCHLILFCFFPKSYDFTWII